MYTNQGLDIPAGETVPRDDGVLLFSRTTSNETIVNGLFAHQPFAPAVDVYDQGALLAGCVYENIGECLADLNAVIQTHLSRVTHIYYSFNRSSECILRSSLQGVFIEE